MGEYLARARAAGMRYADVAEMSEAAVEAVLFKGPEPTVVRPTPDWSAVAADMRQRGVTLQLLWQEYRDRHPDGYSYSQFRRHYRAHQRLSGEPRMRRPPAPAAMCEVDYAGQTMVVATLGGERQASVFVGSLPFSTYIYAEASWTQGADWLGSHVRMFDSWGGSVPKLVPDNLKTGISHASTIRRSTALTWNWRATTASAWCRPGFASRATSRWLRTRCSRWSAGCWRRCATGCSSAWTTSTGRSAKDWWR